MPEECDVVVIGAGLAGIAAAARLAKARHRVILLEQRDRIGGGWATQELDGVTVDAAPPIFSFPAPWRDLFRKSGRALEAEFARSGEDLVPAPPARHIFADGTQFVLPIGRGDQHAAIDDRFGRTAADRWRDLLDSLGEVWQALRPLGVEAELVDGKQLSRTVRKTLLHRRSLANLAADLDHPQLSAVITDLAFQFGSRPDSTPAFIAVQLYLDRTFGRWTAGSGTTMINTLRQRLELRRVEIRTGTRATAIGTGPLSVTTDRDTIVTRAVVATCDAHQLYQRLLPGSVAAAERRRVGRLQPALAPATGLAWADLHTDAGPTETVRHNRAAAPTISYTRRVAGRTLELTCDYRSGRPDPAAGLAWRGFGSWLDRPPTASSVHGLFTAGPFGRGGPGTSQQILSGALAAYAVQRLIAPDHPLEPR
ncbi:NAD(P)/FAD-dependent oxidoreductase [Microlunatus sp. Gsoil 973]|uniref:phytoene desaturase family protein n=1 Tax=Microlunatus sp. Gsoil 973 TaxID=2672569 RepID=UPI0018A83F9C|nr:FAD-dependent oxidoreductase [Microlunatus sp. Gsoil 973]